MKSNFRAPAALVTLAALGSVLAGCNFGDASGSAPAAAQSSPANGAVGGSAPPAAPSPPATGAAKIAPTISGTPAASVTIGAAYAFNPAATAAEGRTLVFAIRNKPAWAAFDAASGTLSGTPVAANVGTYTQISISVSDGIASASLTPFSIGVEQPDTKVTLSWTSPTVNTNGTTVTDLAGYHIYYGSTSTQLNQVVTVEGAEVTEYAFRELSAGTWYFAVAAYNNDKVESGLSAVVPVAI
jgi:Putative Ig domain